MTWLASKGERRSFDPGDVLYEQGQRDAPFYVHRERARRLRRAQARQGDLDRRGRRRDVHRRHRDLHGRAGDGRVRGGGAERRRSPSTARQLRAMLAGSAGARRDRARHPARAARLARGRGARRAPADRRARLAARLRGARPAGAQPAAGAVPRRRRRSAGDDVPGLARHPARGDADPRPRRPRPAQPLRRPGGARPRAARRRRRRSASTSSCWAPGRPGSLRRSTAAPRACSTFVAEAWAPGGQAGTSTRIENYLGFPTGISGTDLTRAATLQARRFDAVFSSFHRAVELADGPEGLVRVDLDDGQHVLARTLVMATGARWRELPIPGRRALPRRGRLPRRDARRRQALPRRGRDRGRRRQLGRAGGDAPGAARAQRAGGGARRAPLAHDVALPRRSHRALAAHRGADRGPSSSRVNGPSTWSR